MDEIDKKKSRFGLARFSLHCLAIKQFIRYAKKRFSKICLQENLLSSDFQLKVIEALQEGFSFQVALEEHLKALILLDEFFYFFCNAAGWKRPTRLALWLSHLPLSDREIKKILISLLYSVYFGDLKLNRFSTQTPHRNVFSFILQICAEHLSEKNLKALLSRLSLNEILSIIAFCAWQEREGTFLIFKCIQSSFSNDTRKKSSLILRLLKGIRRKCIYPEHVFDFLEANPTIREEELAQLLKQLDDHYRNETSLIGELFKKLIVKVIDSPFLVRQYLLSNKMSFSDVKETENLKFALQQMFSHFQQHHALPNKIGEFTSIFGLYGHMPHLKFQESWIAEESLVEKLQFLVELFDRPELLVKQTQEEAKELLFFIFEISFHLHAFFQESALIYSKGAHLLSFALPTKDKDLSRLAWLPSLLESLQAFCAHTKNLISAFPIFVFDQSVERRFKKNKDFIAQLNQTFGSTVFHLSTEQVHMLGRRLRLLPLLETQSSKALGYGGARNAGYFLTPVLHEVFRKGKKTIKQMLSTPASWLQKVMQVAVFGKPDNAFFEVAEAVICMGDDDMQIPVSNLFHDALFAYRFEKSYFTLRYYYYGRRTDVFDPHLDLNYLLRHPQAAYRFTSWTSHPTLGGLNGALSKPKFCLNLPFPCEEQHFRALELFGELFRLPWVHFGKARYPNIGIPTKPFIGLAEHLQSYIPYVFEIILMQWLIYPGKDEQPLFPWSGLLNDKKLTSLYEAFSLIIQNKEKTRSRFWKKLRFEHQQKTSLLYKTLDSFCKYSIKSILEVFSAENCLTVAERDELIALEKVYQKFKKDAEIFREFSDHLLERIPKENEKSLSKNIFKLQKELELKHQTPFSSLPFTNGLLLIVLAIGCGQFGDAVQKAIRLKQMKKSL